MELAGHPDAAPLAAGLDGSSLAPLLEGRAPGRNGGVVSEYLAEGVTSPAVMIRRGAHKFIHCEGDPDQLFDLAEDPSELVNLAERPETAGLTRQFRDEVAIRWDLRDLERRVLESQRERRMVAEALGGGARLAWDYQPRSDGPGRYVRAGLDMYEVQRRARLD